MARRLTFSHPMGTVAPVGALLRVGERLDDLVDGLADRLRVPLPDPFAPELIVVPAAGVRHWLAQRLAERLGITANIEFTFPAALASRALGDDLGGDWTVDRLTWTIRSLWLADGLDDVVRARSVADLFDRYQMYRPTMLARWAEGRDVTSDGQPLPAHQIWQADLWRALIARLGVPESEQIRDRLERLRAEGPDPEARLPERISVFGITSMPRSLLEVVIGVSRHRQVDIHTVTPSLVRWDRLHSAWTTPLAHPVPRSDEALLAGGHPLSQLWGRTADEGQTLLLDAVRAETDAAIEVVPSNDDRDPSLLVALQRDIAGDHHEPARTEVAVDSTLVWHRTFGAGRQVEVLRDHILHLLSEIDDDGAPRYELRDIVVLCADLPTFAPLIESVFAGDDRHGVPSIPLQIADRSVGEENPLVPVVTAVLHMLDGRFRASDVTDLILQPPVRRHLGLDAEQARRAGDLLREANMRWGIDRDDHVAAGIGVLEVHTLRDALDRLVAGHVTGLGPPATVLDIAPVTALPLDDIAVIGALGEVVEALEVLRDELIGDRPVGQWCASLTDVLTRLVGDTDPDTWFQRSEVDRAIAALADSAGGHPSTVPTADLVTLLDGALRSSPGRPRFGTGRLTVSSLTAERGIPHRVVCLLGVDQANEIGGFSGPDDLIATRPCLGDRDRRSEQRAQFLDAVLSAGERLVICSTGFDVRTRAEIPPAVVLSELVEAVERLIGNRFKPIDHPRQTWSERAFTELFPGQGPWSHDRSAARAALARREAAPDIATPLGPLAEAPASPIITVPALVTAMTNPLDLLAQVRLGLRVTAARDRSVDDLIPVDLSGLYSWAVAQQLLDADASGHRRDEVLSWLRRSGDIPVVDPAGQIDEAIDRVDALLESVADHIGTPLADAERLVVDTPTDDGRHIQGSIPMVLGDTVALVTPSFSKTSRILETWTHLALALGATGGRIHRAVVIQRAAKQGVEVTEIVIGADRGAEALDLLISTHDSALAGPVIRFPETSAALAVGDLGAARSAWGASGSRWSGAATEHEGVAAQLLVDLDFDDLLATTDIEAEARRFWSDLHDLSTMTVYSGGAQEGRDV